MTVLTSERGTEPAIPIAAPQSVRLSPSRAFALPLVFTVGLASFGLLDPIRENPNLLWSFIGTAAVLLAWNAALFLSAARNRQTLTLEVVFRKQHYIQACAHTLIFLYWGWYWRQVYDSAYLIVAQLVFAYAFDSRTGSIFSS